MRSLGEFVDAGRTRLNLHAAGQLAQRALRLASLLRARGIGSEAAAATRAALAAERVRARSAARATGPGDAACLQDAHVAVRRALAALQDHASEIARARAARRARMRKH